MYCRNSNAWKMCNRKKRHEKCIQELRMSPQSFCLLVMAAESPFDGKKYYFFDKALPFGSSISCSHFQRFSCAIAHITSVINRKLPINYLDDTFLSLTSRTFVTSK